MTAFNAVRFRVKPGRDQEFLDAHKKVQANWAGLLHVNMIKTGERTYCIIAEWSDMDALANARADDCHARFFPRHVGRPRRWPRRNRSGRWPGGAGAEIAGARAAFSSPSSERL